MPVKVDTAADNERPKSPSLYSQNGSTGISRRHLQNFFENQLITIDKFELKHPTIKRENYASILYPVKITYLNQTETCFGRGNTVS